MGNSITHGKVRVKDAAIFAGYDADGARLQVMPGEYEVEINSDGDLIFRQADTRNSKDLIVRRNEFVEFSDFPNAIKNAVFEFIE